MLAKPALYHDHGCAPSTPAPNPRQSWCIALVLVAVALLIRLVLLPFATLDANDSTSRIWLGWRWADDPFFITNGLWGPLHFYLIGAVLRFWHDPVWAPLALHVVLGALVPVVVYRLTIELFGNLRSAIAAGLIFAFYPAAIAVSLGARVETPFLLLFGIGLIALVRAWRPDGQVRHAVCAGLAITLASALRYEAWMLMPFLTLLLVRHPKRAIAFLATAMIHPVVWMIGNYLEFGNPLFSLTATASYAEDAAGRAPETQILHGLARVAKLIALTGVEMTVPVALLVAAGVIECIRRRRAETALLLLPLAMFAAFAYFTFHDSMATKMSYSTIFGLLLIPYVAPALIRMGVENWSRRRCLAAAGANLIAMGILMSGLLVELLPGGKSIVVNPVPSLADESSVRRIQALLDEAGLTPGEDALMLDNLSPRATSYIAWQSRLHPESICRDPSVANWHLKPQEVRSFLLNNRSGVLITHPTGRLSAHLEVESAHAGLLDGVRLRLSPIGSVDWESDQARRDYGNVSVTRYEVVGAPEGDPVVRPECSRSCPLTLCRHPALLYQ